MSSAVSDGNDRHDVVRADSSAVADRRRDLRFSLIVSHNKTLTSAAIWRHHL